MARRSQEQRRTETNAKLIDATIGSLCDIGYAATSTYAICRRAGVSQGALFNHFDTRLDLIVAATEAICAGHLQRYDAATSGLGELARGKVRLVVEFIRASTRTQEHAAWHEVMVAARTDEELRSRVAPSLRAFEQALLQTATRMFGRAEDDGLGVVVLSILHVFDSEAVTSSVSPSEKIEQQRIVWATALLKAELERETNGTEP